MGKLLYGIWGDAVFTHGRNAGHPDLGGLDEFTSGNGVQAFFGDQGLLVLDENADLLGGLLRHVERAAEESCGRCTPCRAGMPLVRDRLTRLAAGEDGADTLDELGRLADQIGKTSACGLGRTALAPLVAAIGNFRGELEKGIGKGGNACGLSHVTAPCIEACPAHVDVPAYIGAIRDGRYAEALGIIYSKYPLVGTCGRVCDRFCEARCTRGDVDAPVAIKLLKRFVADHEENLGEEWFSGRLVRDKKPEDRKVAVIGAGAAGVSCAYHLLLRGYAVEIFEARDRAGGMARTGIPDYRLPKELLRGESGIIERLGGVFHWNRKLGKDFSLDDLKARGFKAVFLAVGTSLGNSLRLPGEADVSQGYVIGIDMLRAVHNYLAGGLRPAFGERIAVVGGGNVAMDCVRSALRLGVKEAHVIYRRTRAEMPADPEEIEAAEKEGAIFHFLTNPTGLELDREGRVTGVKLLQMRLGEAGPNGRPRPEPVEGSEHVLPVDCLIPAVGQRVDRDDFTNEEGLTFLKCGTIEADPETFMTRREGVFAGGDCMAGPRTVTLAMAQGEEAARCIAEYLSDGKVGFCAENRLRAIVNGVRETLGDKVPDLPVPHCERAHAPELDALSRIGSFDEVEGAISAEDADREAGRCLRCYRVYTVITEN